MLAPEFGSDARTLGCPGGRLPAYVPYSQGIAPLAERTDGIDLFLVDLRSYPWQSRQTWLSPDENHRANKFRFEHDRRRFRASHCAVREVLGRRLARHPAALEFTAGMQGKPRIEDRGGDARVGYSFNLSHSADLAFIGVAADVDVGVDVEQLREVNGLRSLAEQHFTKAELRELLAVPDDRRLRGFLRGWTRKEACLKAVGSGLSIAPSTFHTGLSDDPATAVLETARGPVTVHVQTIELGPQAVAALAWVDRQERIEFQDT